METIKIIDLLNKIANGEKVPYRVKYYDIIYRFDFFAENSKMYVRDETGLKIYLFEVYNNLNDEAEIIEEEKEIEKLDVALLGQCDNWLRCPTNEVIKKDVELNPYIIDNIRENTLYFQRKINELIEAVNELRKEK